MKEVCDTANKGLLAWQIAGALALYGVSGAAVLRQADGAVIGFSAVLGVVLVVLSVIDVRTLRLPDLLTLPLALCGLVAVSVLGLGDVMWHAAAAVAGFVLLVAIGEAFGWARGVDALGMGDAKLFAAAGAWVGFAGFGQVLLAGSVMALAAVAVSRALGVTIGRDTRIPFGPFLAAALWFVWLCGPLLGG